MERNDDWAYGASHIRRSATTHFSTIRVKTAEYRALPLNALIFVLFQLIAILARQPHPTTLVSIVSTRDKWLIENSFLVKYHTPKPQGYHCRTGRPETQQCNRQLIGLGSAHTFRFSALWLRSAETRLWHTLTS